MISLLFSFFINLTVVSTFAYFSGSKISLDLRTAGDALANTFEERGKYIWALGLFASGQSSTLTGGLAGQYVIEVLTNCYLKKHFDFKKNIIHSYK